MSVYLGTEEAAAYLGLKERKLYELAATGAVPCSKVTGKWLFPRAALDRWIESGLARPAGLQPAAPPPIIAGSHDALLEWALRRSGSGLAPLSVGSAEGLERLVRNEAAIAAIHIHAENRDDGNVGALEAAGGAHDAVLIAFARREEGLLVASGNPLRLASLAGAVAAGARFGRRQPGAGAQLLLEKLLRAERIAPETLSSPSQPFATGGDLAFAIRAGEIDCGIATRAVAQAAGLGFLSLGWEHFDLAMRRRTYFEPGPQALLRLMRSEEFQRHAELLGGYDVSEAGAVRFNR